MHITLVTFGKNVHGQLCTVPGSMYCATTVRYLPVSNSPVDAVYWICINIVSARTSSNHVTRNSVNNYSIVRGRPPRKYNAFRYGVNAHALADGGCTVCVHDNRRCHRVQCTYCDSLSLHCDFETCTRPR